MTARVLFRQAVTGWRRFWFAEVPPHSYALLRIGVGVAGILTILGAWDPVYWRLDGLAPVPGSGGAGWGLRHWAVAHGLSTTFGLSLRAVLLIGYILLMAGMRSAIVAPAMFIASGVMLAWNWYPYSAAQHLLHNLTFYLVWVNAGAVWSWDAWRRARRGDGHPDEPQPVWPLRLLRFQIAMMYFSAGLWKIDSPDWRGGVALHYVLNNNIFQRMPGSLPAAAFPFTVLLTYVTLFWELSFPFLLLFRATRIVAVVIGLMLHLGMWSTIEIGAFSLTVLAAYIVFLDPAKTEARAMQVAALFRRPVRGRVSSPASTAS